MKDKRFKRRMEPDGIAASLKHPQLIVDEDISECIVDNISSIGLKLRYTGNNIKKGKAFRIRFQNIEREIQYECIHSVEIKGVTVIGACVINPYDRNILEKYLISN